MSTGIVGASGEIVMKSSATSDKFADYLGFAQAAVTGGFDQMSEDESDKSTSRLGRLDNEFTKIGSQTCEITRIAFIGTDYQLNISCNTTDLVQTDIDSIQTRLGTLSQADCLSFGVLGDASAGNRTARWTWRVGTNGVTSGSLVPAENEYTYVVINR
ncbi:MAG: hypothetical protein Unbinned4512contig1001_28 [Prokaryotic dsDNA virus sp.]|nr:MAG: hypothetical protein Unbinned4512contig1001_28 [Prokaryotic dsDNA virus sp.]|tara:strand:- start:1335 stop:1808 length:474 start_codon:yes stop_codon:yes gene_type:complete